MSIILFIKMEIEESELYTRKIEDVKSIIKHAKLDERNLTHLTQAIYYPDNDTLLENLKLLELDNHLLTQIREGQTIQFKGGLNEKVVLCTEDKTYEVKDAEISNSLLLVPDFKFGQATSTSPLRSPKGGNNTSLERSLNDSGEEVDLERVLESRKVVKVFHEYLECREIKPRFRKLGDLLQMTRYSGPENEYCIDRNLSFSFEQLLDTIQCSRKEFEAGLRLFRAIQIDGKIRVLDYEYEYRIISIMLGLINENSWKLDEIDRDVTIESMDALAPKEIVEGLFDVYTIKSDSNLSKYQYQVHMVARIIAQRILQPGLKFQIEEFLQAWQEDLPDGMIINESYLRGLGIIDRESPLPRIQALSVDNMPTNLHERLKVLFKSKGKWTLEQIEPYMEYFSSPGCTVTTILAKFARSMTVNGQRFYVAKHT